MHVLQDHDLQLVLIADAAQQVVVIVANLLTREILAIGNAEVAECLEYFSLKLLDVAVEEVEKRFEHFIADGRRESI